MRFLAKQISIMALILLWALVVYSISLYHGTPLALGVLTVLILADKIKPDEVKG